MNPRAELDRLAEARGELARELLAVFDAAAQPILADAAIWVEEARRDAAARLPWPLQQRGAGEAQLLRILAAATVANVLQAIEQAHGPHWVPPQDPADDDFQTVLRVAKRATDAGQAALRARFGGAGRLSIKRELLKIVRELQAEAAFTSDKPLADALKAAGLSKASAYRAQDRKQAPKRRRRH